MTTYWDKTGQTRMSPRDRLSEAWDRVEELERDIDTVEDQRDDARDMAVLWKRTAARLARERNASRSGTREERDATITITNSSESLR